MNGGGGRGAQVLLFPAMKPELNPNQQAGSKTAAASELGAAAEVRAAITLARHSKKFQGWGSDAIPCCSSLGITCLGPPFDLPCPSLSVQEVNKVVESGDGTGGEVCGPM